MKNKLRIVVLYNKDYEEDKAIHTVIHEAAVELAEGLTSRGHNVVLRPVNADDVPSFIDEMKTAPPDLVFNCVESLCQDTKLETIYPAIMDLMNIPYTGSNSKALKLATDKALVKEILLSKGISTPRGYVVDNAETLAKLPFPLIVKPTKEDSSVGIYNESVVYSQLELSVAIDKILKTFEQPALVEEYIDGRELYVSLLGNPPVAFPLHEIDFTGLPADWPKIVSYDAKWSHDSVHFECTQHMQSTVNYNLKRKIEAMGRKAFVAIGLSDYARMDLRLSKDGIPYIIDVNPNCDIQNGSGFPNAASYAEVSYPRLLEKICLAALERHQKKTLKISKVSKLQITA